MYLNRRFVDVLTHSPGKHAITTSQLHRVIRLRLCTTCCRFKTNPSKVSPVEKTRESLAEA